MRFQIRPDLVALTALNRARPPEVHHDVITNLAPGQQKPGQTGSPRGHELSFPLAFGETAIDGFTTAEQP